VPVLAYASNAEPDFDDSSDHHARCGPHGAHARADGAQAHALSAERARVGVEVVGHTHTESPAAREPGGVVCLWIRSS